MVQLELLLPHTWKQLQCHKNPCDSESQISVNRLFGPVHFEQVNLLGKSILTEGETRFYWTEMANDCLSYNTRMYVGYRSKCPKHVTEAS